MTARALSVEDLLMHRSWLHRLAVHIVRDDELAHDLVQETWLAALDAAPPSEEKVRPWLAGVLRNLARMSIRTAVRRRGRERACVDGEDALPSPEELLARVEAQELLVNEVRRLDEPYRTTILLLYFEGLPATDVARRLGVPEGTIRWRHRQALESLRAVLAEKDPQHRRLHALLVPAGYATAVAIESGLLGSKGLWTGLALVLASLLSLWPGEAPVQRAREDVGPRAAGMSAATPVATVPAARLPGVRVVLPEAGVELELLVRVTDPDDVPIAGATARIGELAVGRTAANGRLVVAEETRPRIPDAGAITVHAPAYQAVTAAYRLAQPLHVRLVPLAGAEADEIPDSDHRYETDDPDMPRAALPVSAAFVGWPPNRIRCSTAELLTNNLHRMNKELSMRLMSPKLHAMVLAMVSAVNTGGCIPEPSGTRSGDLPNEELESPSDFDPNDGNDHGDGGGSCTPADPCAGATGTGSYVGVRCDGETPFEMEPSLACADARARCQLEAGEKPAQSIYCEWNGIEIFRHEASAGSCNAFGPAPSDGCEPPPPSSCDHPCSGSSETGSYRGYFCGDDAVNFIQTNGIDCQAALGNCALNAATNPGLSIVCEWNGQEIFRREVEAGECNALHGPSTLTCAMPAPDGCDGYHPCTLTEGGPGSYSGSFCDSGAFIQTPAIDCQAALGNCMLNAAVNPDLSIQCEWQGAEIYRREVEAGACDSLGKSCEAPSCGDPCEDEAGTGSYYALGCDDASLQHRADGVTCQSARELCTQMVSADPSQSLRCVWNDREILRHEVSSGTCDRFGLPYCFE